MSVLYKNTCLSLLECDKLLFSFLMCTKLLIFRRQLNGSELRYLVVGGSNDATEPENPNKGIKALLIFFHNNIIIRI